VTEDQEPSNRPTTDASAESGGVTPSEGEPQTAEPVVSETSEPVERDVRRRREQVRGTVTYLLMGIFAGVLIVGAIALFIDAGVWTNARDYLQVAVPAVTGLLGTAMGFYFGRLR
jgi:hypothetical protein